MMRYIFCMLLGALTMLGIYMILAKDMQEGRAETGTSKDIQYHSETTSDGSGVYIHQSFDNKGGNRGNDLEGINCNASKGVLRNISSSHVLTLSKILRCNPGFQGVLNPNSPDKLFSEKNRTTHLPQTHLTKYSYRYYIYSLRRILI